MEIDNQLVKWAERSATITKLAPAVSKFQGALEPVKKEVANPFLNKKYADLSAVWEAIREPLAANELSILQEPQSADGKISLTTTLMHSSGEYVRSTLTFPVTKQDPQGYGSAITYARRYALQSVTGIAPEDDDGIAAAQGNGEQKRQPAAQPKKIPSVYDLSRLPAEKREEAIKILRKLGAVTEDELMMRWESPVPVAKLVNYQIEGA